MAAAAVPHMAGSAMRPPLARMRPPLPAARYSSSSRSAALRVPSDCQLQPLMPNPYLTTATCHDMTVPSANPAGACRTVQQQQPQHRPAGGAGPRSGPT